MSNSTAKFAQLVSGETMFHTQVCLSSKLIILKLQQLSQFLPAVSVRGAGMGREVQRRVKSAFKLSFTLSKM